MTTTPKLGIPLISSQQAQPEVTHNQMVLLVQAVLAGAIAQQNAPPGSPGDGDVYVVGSAGSGAFSGHDNAIAIFYGGWNFIPGVDDDGVQIDMGADQLGLELTIAGVPSVWDGTVWAAAGGGGGEESIAMFTDTPANPGWDPKFCGPPGAFTLSNSNKNALPASGGPYNHIFATPARFTGKLYFEFKPGSGSFAALGLCGGAGHYKFGDGNPFGGGFLGQLGWNPGGDVKSCKQPGNSYTITTIQGWGSGDNLGVAVDLDAGLVWFRTNTGNWNNNGANDPATGVGGIDLSYCFSGASNGLIWPGGNTDDTGTPLRIYLLAADWANAAPSGFAAWGA